MPREDFVSGHYAFSSIATAYPAARYVTVLREPRARLLSHWAFWRSLHDELDGLGAWATYVRKARGSLVDFLSDPEIACQTDNVTTRALIWPQFGTSQSGFITRERARSALDAARSVLPRFSLIGLLEDCDLAMELSTWLGTPLKIPRLNETRSMRLDVTIDLLRELTPNSLDLIHERTRLDSELWMEVAIEKFGTQATSVAEDAFTNAITKFSRLLGGDV